MEWRWSEGLRKGCKFVEWVMEQQGAISAGGWTNQIGAVRSLLQSAADPSVRKPRATKEARAVSTKREKTETSFEQNTETNENSGECV